METTGEDMISMFDAAYPPTFPPNPQKVEAAAGYIGGNTPHVWTEAEWNRMPQPFRLPIWTTSHPELHDGTVDGAKAAKWLTDHSVPKGCWVALDLETAINKTYVNAFDAQIIRVGYLLTIYGSKSTIIQNPIPSGGYWVADWTGFPHMASRAVITQWASDTMLKTGWDMNLVDIQVKLWQLKGDPPVTIDDAIIAINEHADELYRLLARGELPTGGTDGRESIKTLATRLAVVESAIKTGVPVELTGMQLAALSDQVVFKLATDGLKLSGSMTGTIELGGDA
jgi:hypothetical protein